MTTAYCHAMARKFERWDAEDLAQDLLVLVWKLRRSGERRPEYVYRSIKNFCLNHWRRRKLEGRWLVPLEATPEAMRNEMAVGLLQTLLELMGEWPEGEIKKIFQLTGMGYTLREIGREMRLSKSQIHKIMGKMRDYQKGI